MSKVFDLNLAIQKWCKENGHDGFYCNEGDPCGCKAEDLAPCGEAGGIMDGCCKGGKLHDGSFVDANGQECDWAIVPHDYESTDAEIERGE